MLQQEIEVLFEAKPEKYDQEHFRLFADFKQLLNSGEARAARLAGAAAGCGQVVF